MPELPEVETVRRGIEKYVVGHRIESVEILHPKPFQGSAEQINGAKIVGIKRIGKGLIIELSNNYSLAIHIKLTGQLVYRDKKTKNAKLSTKVGSQLPNKFTHVIFKLLRPNAKSDERKTYLYYNDQRRFGWIKVLPTSEVSQLPFFKNMGPEPPVVPLRQGSGGTMEGRSLLSLEYFEKLLEGKNTKIKPFIMDQTRIGGIGNIYANDALFDAKILPTRSAKSLTKLEIKRLFNSILKVMKKSFEEGGASELSFVNILGQEGNYQNHSLVYGKTGKKCPRCKTVIKRINLGGRGTFYCENCQK